MKILNTTIAALSVGCLLSLSAPASEEVALEGAEVGRWTMDYEAAAKLATEKKLPMMLNFTGSDWCGWCKLMDREVFAKDEWKEFAAKNIVLVTIDFPRDKSIVPEKFAARNNELKEQFGVGGYPTYVIAASGIGPPGPKAGRRPPLSRTSAMNASGSSSYGFAPKAVHHFP